MLNVIRCRGTLQSQWSKLTDSKSRKAEQNVSVTNESRSSWIVAGTEQVVLQMTPTLYMVASASPRATS